MIFKYCSWPSETKEDTKVLADGSESRITVKGGKFTESVLRCCPCVFRCRRAIGIGNETAEQTSSTGVSNQLETVTPVIALSLNRSSDTIEKSVIDEEGYNERNRLKFSIQSIIYPDQNENEETQNEVLSPTRNTSPSSSISNFSIDGKHKENVENVHHDQRDTTNSRSPRNRRTSSHQIQAEKKAFDIITEQTIARRRNSFESYIVSNKKSSRSIKAADINIDEDFDKELCTKDEEASIRRKQSIIEFDNEKGIVNEGENTSEEDIIARNIVRTKSASSILSVESALTIRISAVTNLPLPSSQSLKELNEARSVPSLDKTSSSKETDMIFSNRSFTNNPFSNRHSASSLESIRSPQKKWGDKLVDGYNGEVHTSTYPLGIGIFESLDFRNSCIENTNSIAILATSRSRTPEISECDNAMGIVDSNISLHSSVNMQLSSKSSNPQRFIPNTLPGEDDTSSSHQLTGSEEPVESTGSENIPSADLPFEIASSVHQLDSLKQTTKTKMKPRGNVARVAPMSVRNFEKDKTKTSMQQCFTQLESKDWEITMKGLHALSLVAKQTPEQLDSCTPGTIVRLLGRHVRNLRSQVSRAACLAAGDIFCLHIRGIDQDLDDLAGPLLNRTADTNKFLRADSNVALDRMVEHLPPQRTIGIIVNRGATHQNAIVRAATARLLCAIVDRVGPDHIMVLPRDIRDKLLSIGAKLLIDGNLNARNHAKEIFRRLTRCEGFRKALAESVPETTLRHIEKTLKSL